MILRPCQSFLLLLLFSLGGAIQDSFAQSDSPYMGKDSPLEDGYKDMHEFKKKQRPMLTIITRKPKKYLVGNQCVTLYTASMGFVYTPSHPGTPRSAEYFHNLGTKFRLFFSAGPFWRIKVNRRIKRCKKSSGDFRHL